MHPLPRAFRLLRRPQSVLFRLVRERNMFLVINGDPCTEDIICCSGLCDGEMCSPCQNANDCRPPASQCKQATCNNGVCGEEDVLDGTLCDDDQNPCTMGVGLAR
jgi:hypothetical protein